MNGKPFGSAWLFLTIAAAAGCSGNEAQVDRLGTLAAPVLSGANINIFADNHYWVETTVAALPPNPIEPTFFFGAMEYVSCGPAEFLGSGWARSLPRSDTFEVHEGPEFTIPPSFTCHFQEGAPKAAGPMRRTSTTRRCAT